MKVEKQFYSVTEAAAYLNISRRTVQRWVYSGKLPAVKIGSKNQIPAEELQRLIDAGQRSMQK